MNTKMNTETNTENKKTENTLQEEIYDRPSYSVFFIILSLFSLIFLGIILNFSFKDKLLNKLLITLRDNKSCPIGADNASLSLLPPSLDFHNFTLGEECLGTNYYTFKTAKVSLGIPSLSPLGPKASIFLHDPKTQTKIQTYAVVGLNTILLKIDQTRLSFDLISKMLNDAVKFSGSLETKLFLEIFKQREISNGAFFMESSDFSLPSQNMTIQGMTLTLPTLFLKDFIFKATIKKNLLNIENFILGNDMAPIHLGFTGTIQINPQQLGTSTFNLEVEAKFSEKFLSEFGLIKILLGNKPLNEKGAYKFPITGTFSSPQF